MVAAMWERGQPIAATPAEAYLASRGLKPGVSDAGELRFIPEARGYAATAESAMVAAVRDNAANSSPST